MQQNMTEDQMLRAEPAKRTASVILNCEGGEPKKANTLFENKEGFQRYTEYPYPC